MSEGDSDFVELHRTALIFHQYAKHIETSRDVVDHAHYMRMALIEYNEQDKNSKSISIGLSLGITYIEQQCKSKRRKYPCDYHFCRRYH